MVGGKLAGRLGVRPGGDGRLGVRPGGDGRLGVRLGGDGRLGVRPGGDGRPSADRRQSGDGLLVGGDLRDRLSSRPVVADAREILSKTVLKRVDNNGKLVLSTKKKDVGPDKRDRMEDKMVMEEPYRRGSYAGDHCDREGGNRRSLDDGRSGERDRRGWNDRDDRRLSGADRGGRGTEGVDRSGRNMEAVNRNGRRSMEGIDMNRRSMEGIDRKQSMDGSKGVEVGGDLRSRLGKNDGNKRKLGSESYDDLLDSAMGKTSRRDRSRSPVDRKPYERARGERRKDYDDPEEVEKAYERTVKNVEVDDIEVDRTLAGKLDPEGNFNGVSPLQGSKVVVTNLQASVTQDDIEELFLDMGALKRVKMDSPGSSEVTYVTRKDAEKAVERYNNVTLDGKAMKCRVVGLCAPPGCGGATLKLPSSLVNRKRRKDEDLPDIEIESVYKALFRKKGVGQKLLFADIAATSAKKLLPWLPEDIVNAMVNSKSLNL